MTPGDPETITVHGTTTDPGATELRGAEVRQVPGAFGDAFRAIEALPGVTPTVSGLPFFFVRGAPPGNSGYYLDGVRVPALYHVAVGPSIFPSALVDHVDFYPGGFPARFGGFTGGIVAAETLRPAAALHGDATVRLFDAGALLEAPVLDGRLSVLGAARYSYSGLAVSVFSPETRIGYWDYQARASYRLDEDDTLTTFAFGSSDYLAQLESIDPAAPPKTHVVFDSTFHRVDLRWDRALGGGGTSRLAFTIGYDRTGNDDGTVHDYLAALRYEAQNDIASDVRARGGADVTWDHFDAESSAFGASASQPGLAEFAPRNDVVLGAWGDVVWRPSSRVEITPGLRADVFTSRRVAYPPGPSEGGATAIPAIDPRLATRIRLTNDVVLVSTFGVAHQPPSFAIPVPGIGLSTLADGLQSSVQTSQGVEVRLPLDVTATVTGFVQRYFNLDDAADTCPNLSPDFFDEPYQPCFSTRVNGRAYGAEILVRRSLTRHLTGWLSYTLSRATRDSGIVGTSGTVPATFDRTHVLDVVGAYDLGRMWRAGARFYFYTGRPWTRQDSAPDAERYPPFWRIDLRVEKAWRVGGSGKIAVVFEGLNVTLNKEATDVNCAPSGSQCTFAYLGPVAVPSIGVEGSF